MPKITRHRNNSVSLNMEGDLIISLADLLDALDLSDTMTDKEEMPRLREAQDKIRETIRQAYGY